MLKREKEVAIKAVLMHSIAKRARYNIKDLALLKNEINEIAHNIYKIRGIKKVAVNTLTGSIVINYNDKICDSTILNEEIDLVLAQYSMIYMQRYQQKYADEEDNTEVSMTSKEIMTRLVANGSTLLISNTLLKNSNNLENKSALSTFTSLQGIVSCALSLPMAKSAIKGLAKTKRPNSDFLTVVSIIASLLLKNGNSSLLILALSDIAELMTSYTIERTRASIKKMLNVDSTSVWCKTEDGSLEKRDIAEVNKGDQIVIHTGEKIAIDGIIQSGMAVIDQSAITGEFVPVERTVGESVFAGTIIKSGNICVEATNVGDNTVVSRIVHMVEESEMKKAPIQKYADKFSNYLVPLNFALSLAVYLATKDAQKALKMLVIDYSCGIKLSTAAAFSATINNAVKQGILIKGGAYIEQMSKANTVLLDKTGTVTKGKPKVVSMLTFDTTLDEKTIVGYAIAAEETSTHPLASAILDYGYSMEVEMPIHDEVLTFIGRGTQTMVDGHLIRVGSEQFMKDNNLIMPENAVEYEGAIANYVAIDNKVVAVIFAMDQLRTNIRRAVNTLRYDGVCDIELLTGDMKAQANQVANMIGADSFKAQLMPEDKAEAVIKLQSQGHGVIMVGDGINDAPALAYADVGISMGSKSTDIAMETSDIVINRDDPMTIADLRELSMKSMRIINQNFGLVIGINSIGLVLGAASNISVMLSSVLHNMSTILVVGNSMRLLLTKNK